jgi:DNA-binding transcriptional MerR regulator
LLTSKEVIERTGISRATLHNYIGTGLLPRPDVLPPQPEDGDAPRIGYFPDDTIERVATIQRLKRQGWSIARIAEYFARPAAAAEPAQPPRASMPDVSARQSYAADTAPSPLPLLTGALPAPRGAPVLTPVATLVATLQDAHQLWIRLPAREYFELVNEIWSELDPVFRSFQGQAGRHPDEGLVSYFFPQPAGGYLWNAVAAADAARNAMLGMSRRWQARKGWELELFMNTGIDEGRDWAGPAGAADLRVLGEAAHRAEQLSRCARDGAILVTRGFVGKLPPTDAQRIAFGVPRDGGAAALAPLLHTFTRLQDIAAPGLVPARLADLAVAQIFELGPRGAPPAAAQEATP